jgi:Di-haem cytochrome c peroxidase
MKLGSVMFVLALGAFTTAADGAELKLKLPLGLQESAAYVPDDNPLTPEKIALGKQFFWDKRWSRNGTLACVTCHEPNHGWGDPRQFSSRFDGKPTSRHSPTLVNRLFSDAQQWTGQRTSLEDQAIKASDQSPELLVKTWALFRTIKSSIARFSARISTPTVSPKRSQLMSGPSCRAIRPSIVSTRAIKKRYRQPRSAAWLYSRERQIA